MKKIRYALFTFVALLAMGTRAMAQEKQQAEVDVFVLALSDSTVQLVDVRSPEEFTKGHIKGAVLANWRDSTHFEAQAKQLDKQRPVYVYCRSGNRSNQAADWLLQQGFKNVVNLEGGIIAWEAAGKKVEKEDPF